MYLALVALCLSTTSSDLRPSSFHACSHAAPLPVQNANHIFNAIHSSMRQWGSSLNHNGMSFFLAHIPAGTELYHGRGDNITVKGTEWLAFEPEHAMNFARKVFAKPRPPNDGEPPPDEHDAAQQYLTRHSDFDFIAQTASRHQQLLGSSRAQPHPDKDTGPPQRRPSDDFRMLPGYLHNYKTTRPLRTLYLDGQSAAKSGKGTLDTQDYLLTPSASTGDYSRAHAMCSLAAKEWGGKIDGFIRMEHGFELILCDFEESVELSGMQKVGPWGEIEEDVGAFLFSFLRAITARYQGIGGERVRVEYGDFVTAFAVEGIDLFGGEAEDGHKSPNPNPLPRLNHITTPQREGLMASLTALVLKDPPSHSLPEPAEPPINWQSITDLIIARYSDALHTLAFGPMLSKPSLHHTLTLLLRPFIDYNARDEEAEAQRCKGHFIPLPGFAGDEDDIDAGTSVAGDAISHVSGKICGVLFDALFASSPSTSSRSSIQIQRSLQQLTTYLSWGTWKDCRPGCLFDEFCFTAIWPVGDTRSHESPYCVNASALGTVVRRPGSGRSYWDGGRR